jgi:hypothetical protein
MCDERQLVNYAEAASTANSPSATERQQSDRFANSWCTRSGVGTCARRAVEGDRLPIYAKAALRPLVVRNYGELARLVEKLIGATLPGQTPFRWL